MTKLCCIESPETQLKAHKNMSKLEYKKTWLLFLANRDFNATQSFLVRGNVFFFFLRLSQKSLTCTKP